MASNKECECIKSALGSVMWASSLENNGMLASKGEIRLRKDIILGDETRIRNINDLIHRDATELRNELKGIDKNCDLSGADIMDRNNLIEGRARLERVIDSRGSEIDKAQLAGTRINDAIQNMTFKKNLVRCTD